MNFYVYILKSLKDNKLYIGYTTDFKKRIEYHNSGLNTSTKNRRPFKLLFAESFINEKDARKRERFFKTGHGREEIKKILEHTLNAGIV